MSSLPMMLHYNCQRPDLVLDSLIIQRSSVIKERYRGVSMSTWSELGSHGPFKIAFRRSVWFNQFVQVQYGSPPHKNVMFKDEQEWCSEEDVHFSLDDVVYVAFMTNAPCVLGLRTLQKVKATLSLKYPKQYGTTKVFDPYLNPHRDCYV